MKKITRRHSATPDSGRATGSSWREMKRKLFSSRWLQIRYEPRWPALAIGFYGGAARRKFVILCAPIVIEIG